MEHFRGPRLGVAMRLFLCAVIAWTVLPAGEARPQDAPDFLSPLTLGSRVRLSAPTIASRRIQGVVLQIDPEYLVIGGSRADPLRVSRRAITGLEIRTGRRGNAWKGMGIGAGFGALGWGIHPCVNEGCAKGFSPELAVYGALLGGISGAGVGALIKSDRWSDVPLDRVRVGLIPARGRGAGLCLSIGF
jgi:hypothetical protein